MAELIDKNVLIEYIKTQKEGNEYMCRLCLDAMCEIVDDQPATTEAEIRAKAIDEFAEKLHELCGMEIGDYQYPDILHESRIDEIVEQLKGE